MLLNFKELFHRYDVHPKGVLHVGANVGEEFSTYMELGIRRQIWIEPNPVIFEKLRLNVSSNPEAVCLNFACGDENKKMMLHVANNAGQSSSILELGTHKQSHPDVHFVEDVEVDVFRFEDWYGTFLSNCDLLVMDVQGYEGHVLRGMGSLLRQFKWVYTEVNKNEVYKGCATLLDMDLFMTANGFKRVELFNSGGFFDRLLWSDAFYVR